MSFSKRTGAIPESIMQIGYMKKTLKNRLYNVLNKTFPKDDDWFADYFGEGRNTDYEYIREYVLDKLGVVVKGTNLGKFDELFLQGDWYVPYDILEHIIELMTMLKSFDGYVGTAWAERLEQFSDSIQQVLIEENSGYRLASGLFVPITNENELDSLKSSLHTQYDSVNTHMQKAVAMLASRAAPDYENSIKESISAVEALCCIITGATGRQATLGAAIKRLNTSGVVIHGALEKAFEKLYGYTSDEGGIRHGAIDFYNAPEEDARFMLVACSAFINYLSTKTNNLYTKTHE